MPDGNVCVTHTDCCRLAALLNRDAAVGQGSRHWRAELEETLETADRIDSCRAPADLVTMNTKLVLDDLQTGASRMATLVYPDDEDLPNGISVLEPLGTALLGHHVGDVIECPDQKCHKRLRVSEILFQPEQASARYL